MTSPSMPGFASLLEGPRPSATALGLVACLALGIAVPAQAVTYSVSLNTSAIAGTTGSVDFQWNLGTIHPALTATVSSFAGTSLVEAPTLLSGNASGDLAPGHSLSFAATDPFNYVYQNLTYGSSISFRLTLPDAAPAIGSFASGFSVAVLDQNQLPLLPGIASDANLALLFTLSPGAAPTVQASTAATVNTVSAVPEPSSVALLLAGLASVGVAARRASRSRR